MILGTWGHNSWVWSGPPLSPQDDHQLSCWQGARQVNTCVLRAVTSSRPMFLGLDTEIKMAEWLICQMLPREHIPIVTLALCPIMACCR